MNRIVRVTVIMISQGKRTMTWLRALLFLRRNLKKISESPGNFLQNPEWMKILGERLPKDFRRCRSVGSVGPVYDFW